ncbi:glycosyltransferase family 4 protein [Altericroceibacterium endophyticum]|nr:glycosyltransferase family 1 protein [Altericroceibacterium endophyticum]
MRIGVDGHVLTGKFQGTRTTLGRLLNEVSQRAGAHSLLLYSYSPDEARELLGHRAIAHRQLPPGGAIWRLLLQFPRLFRRDAVDLGVFQYIAPLRGRHMVFIHDLLPLTHPHLFPWRMRLRSRLFFTLSIRRAAMVVAVSDYTGDQIRQRLNIPRERLAVVKNGPSFPQEAYWLPRETGDQRYILAVGRIEPRKNMDLLVRAFRQASLHNVKLVIVGTIDPAFRHAEIEGAGVEIRTDVSDTELQALYRNASLFVFPSSAEGFGLPLLDAVLFGLPTISSDRTAMPEVGGDCAVYFNPDADDAQAVLADLIAGHFALSPIVPPSPEQRCQHHEQFNWGHAAQQFLTAAEAAYDA